MSDRANSHRDEEQEVGYQGHRRKSGRNVRPRLTNAVAVNEARSVRDKHTGQSTVEAKAKTWRLLEYHRPAHERYDPQEDLVGRPARPPFRRAQHIAASTLQRHFI